MTLEQLLNKLIEKGWKPRNIECTGVKSTDYCLEFYTKAIGWISKDERHLVSKNSWLWQFVCENGMLNKKRWSNRVRLETSSVWDYIEIWTWADYGWKFDSDYEYRVIESALCDEDKLEQFLLQSIVINND